MDNRFDVIVIGAGPSGMTAAVYAIRAGLKTAILESMAPGGKMIKTYEIQNWPGIKEISGADLAMQMFDHCTSLGAEYLAGKVVKIEADEKEKRVICQDGSGYLAKAIIVATGTQERLLNIPGEKEYTGKGVSYCAVCDGMFFKNKTVTIIGGGNGALEEALYLADLAEKVNIVIRRDVFRAEPFIQDRILNKENIQIIKKHIPLEIKGDGNKVTSICLKNLEDESILELETAAVFPYIGADPCTESVQDLNILDEQGYILVNEKMETAVKGIYGAGDCTKKVLRQVVTAASDGAVAAQSATVYVKER